VTIERGALKNYTLQTFFQSKEEEQAQGTQSGVKEFQIANGRLSGPAEEDFLTVYTVGADVSRPGLMICRLGAQLYYANAEFFMNEVLSFVRHAPSTLRWFILRFDAVDNVDYVAAKMLMELADRIGREHVALVFADLSKEVEEFLFSCGVLEIVGSDKVFASIDAAVAASGHFTLSAR
jgi:MFS superfamily sulfate permease-like transporter